MVGPRRRVADKDSDYVLTQSLRRCCLCVYLNNHDKMQKGQIAHLDRDRTNNARENLVYLCFEHHNEYDSRPSQSKAFTHGEVRKHRDRLYARNQKVHSEELGQLEAPAIHSAAKYNPFTTAREKDRRWSRLLDRQWNFPLWQTADQMEMFAYKATNNCDSVCLIERIDLPDGRIAIACVQAPGSSGNSITNCVEELCFQVCERFKIPPKRLVWLEGYPQYPNDSWNLVEFAQRPPDGMFDKPTWTELTPDRWRALRLRPRRKKQLVLNHFHYESLLTKLFPWEAGEALFDPDA